MFLVIFIILSLDRLSKYFIVEVLKEKGEMIPIIPPFFNLTLTFNKGAAFGIFAGKKLFLILFALVGITILYFFYRSEKKNNKYILYPISFIIGGALGNLFDRIRYGQVIDFLDIDFPDIIIPAKKILFIHFTGFNLYRWPAFNIADSFICIGIFLLFIFTLTQKKTIKK